MEYCPILLSSAVLLLSHAAGRTQTGFTQMRLPSAELMVSSEPCPSVNQRRVYSNPNRSKPKTELNFTPPASYHNADLIPYDAYHSPVESKTGTPPTPTPYLSTGLPFSNQNQASKKTWRNLGNAKNEVPQKRTGMTKPTNHSKPHCLISNGKGKGRYRQRW